METQKGEKSGKARAGIEKFSQVKKIKGKKANKVFSKEVKKLAEKYGWEPLFFFSYEKEEGKSPIYNLEVES